MIYGVALRIVLPKSAAWQHAARACSTTTDSAKQSKGGCALILPKTRPCAALGLALPKTAASQNVDTVTTTLMPGAKAPRALTNTFGRKNTGHAAPDSALPKTAARGSRRSAASDRSTTTAGANPFQAGQPMTRQKMIISAEPRRARPKSAA